MPFPLLPLHGDLTNWTAVLGGSLVISRFSLCGNCRKVSFLIEQILIYSTLTEASEGTPLVYHRKILKFEYKNVLNVVLNTF